MLPFPSPGDLPDPGIEPRSPSLQADSLLFEPPGSSLWDATPILLHGLETWHQAGSPWTCLYEEKELSPHLGIFL